MLSTLQLNCLIIQRSEADIIHSEECKLKKIFFG